MKWTVCIVAWLSVGMSYANWQYHTPTLGTKTTWKDMKDDKVTKQDVDYSCGASSLSTILTYFYQNPKTESEILDDMALDDVMASFLDLAKVSEKYGYTINVIVVLCKFFGMVNPKMLKITHIKGVVTTIAISIDNAVRLDFACDNWH